MGVMSQAQKDQLAWVVRIIMVCGMGIASTVGMSVYNKVDELYAINKLYHEKILQLEQDKVEQKEVNRDVRVELKELRQQYFDLRHQINTKTQ